MNWKNTELRFGSLTIGIHWLMFVLLVAVYASIEMRVLFEKGTPMRDAFKMWHFMLGLLILVLIWFRIAARFFGPTPSIQPEPPRIQQLAAKLLHLALYLLMIGMPLTGWLMLSAAGKPIPFFGLELPALIPADKDVESQLKVLHEFVGTASYFLLALHVAAAFYHHHFQRDNTLTRMLPIRE